MDKKIIPVSIVIIIIAAFYLFQNEDVVQKPEISEKPTNKTIKNVTSQPTELTIETKNKDKTKPTDNTTAKKILNVKQPSASPITENKQNKDLTDSNNQIKLYLKEHKYKKITVNKNVAVYVKNPPKKQSDFMPPALPTIINVKFNNKTVPIVIDSNIIQTNKELFVEQNGNIVKVNLENQTEQTQDTDKNIKILTPPSIGQN